VTTTTTTTPQPFYGRFSGTTWVSHPPIFYRPDALPATQPTVSKH